MRRVRRAPRGVRLRSDPADPAWCPPRVRAPFRVDLARESAVHVDTTAALDYRAGDLAAGFAKTAADYLGYAPLTVRVPSLRSPVSARLPRLRPGGRRTVIRRCPAGTREHRRSIT